LVPFVPIQPFMAASDYAVGLIRYCNKVICLARGEGNSQSLGADPAQWESICRGEIDHLARFLPEAQRVISPCLDIIGSVASVERIASVCSLSMHQAVLELAREITRRRRMVAWELLWEQLKAEPAIDQSFAEVTVSPTYSPPRLDYTFDSI